jgi:uncharacterized surface protein with fasciclin (FAS1) repeats
VTTRPKWLGAWAGVAAAIAALGTSELIASLSPRLPSPIVAVGDLVIDRVPPPLKDLAIRLFGTNDKLALLAGILLVILAYASVVGVLAQRRGLNVGRVGIGVFGLLGAGADLVGQSGPIGMVPSLAGAAIGMLVLGWVIKPADPRRESSDSGRREFVLRAADRELLTSILTYHVVGGESLDMASLAEAGSITTVNVADLSIAAVGDVIEVNGVAATICGNVQTANATVHIIDTVLVPAA